MNDGRDISQGGELEFFGVKLRVRSARLAELLNADVDEDRPMIALRAPEALVPSDYADAEGDVERRILLPECSVRVHPAGIADG